MIARPVTPEDITATVVESFEHCPDPRLREIMQALVRHLHGFAIEVGLTLPEWNAAIRILTATGHITDERRQEFNLWSDSLGLSMVVDAIAHTKPPGATESTVLGPFHAEGSVHREYGASIIEQPGGVPTWYHGRILDLEGAPIPGAELDVWQNDETELYAVQDPTVPEQHLRGRFLARDDGSYAFLGVRPTDYAIPNDGPVGAMLAATGRHPWRPAHLHLIARADGFETLVTHIFDSASERLESDAVFAVKPSLVREFVRHDPGEPGTPAGVTGEWYSVENDVVLVPSGA
jgi:protocatechuate 3,4-dioxygenase beta subunit